MKKILVLLIMIMMSISLYAQQNTVYIYKCNKTSISNKKDSSEKLFESNFLIKVDLITEVISIDNEPQSKYYIRSQLQQSVELKDSEGDIFTRIKFSAYDEEGISCYLYIIEYKTLNIIVFVAEYNDLVYQWQASKLE